MARPLVVFSILGTTLDTGRSPQRWERWRPTVALCQHDDLPIARLELLHGPQSTSLAASIIEDILKVSPETTVRTRDFITLHPLKFESVGELLEQIWKDVERTRQILGAV